MSTQGGTHEQHANAGKQSHGGAPQQHAEADKQTRKMMDPMSHERGPGSSERGEQRGEPGKQSHKNM